MGTEREKATAVSQWNETASDRADKEEWRHTEGRNQTNTKTSDKTANNHQGDGRRGDLESNTDGEDSSSGNETHTTTKNVSEGRSSEST